jgi:hypothetical protein
LGRCRALGRWKATLFAAKALPCTPLISEVLQGFGKAQGRAMEGGPVNSRQSLALPACDAKQRLHFSPPEADFSSLCNHSICCVAACPLRPKRKAHQTKPNQTKPNQTKPNQTVAACTLRPLPFRGGMAGMGGYTESSGQPPSKKPPPMPPTKAVPPPPVTLATLHAYAPTSLAKIMAAHPNRTRLV